MLRYSGQIDDVNFVYEDNTQVEASCTASLNGDMYVFGGKNQRKQVGKIFIHLDILGLKGFYYSGANHCFQISKIQNCKLTRIGDLDFNFSYGVCNTFSFGILLCFDYFNDQDCYS